MKSLILLFSLLFVFSSQTSAEGKLYKKNEKIVLTYNEFRKLSKSNQEAWIKELRDFNRKMDLINAGQRITPKKKTSYWSLLSVPNLQEIAPRFCSAFDTFNRLSVAQAQAGTVNCSVSPGVKDPGLTCFTCLSGVTVVSVVCEDKGNPDTVAKKMLERLKSPEYASNAADINLTQAALALRLKQMDSTNAPVAFSAIARLKNGAQLPVVAPTSVQTGTVAVAPISQVEESFLPPPPGAPPTLDAPFVPSAGAETWTAKPVAPVPMPDPRRNVPLPRPRPTTPTATTAAATAVPTGVAAPTTEAIPDPAPQAAYGAVFGNFPTSTVKELQDTGDASKNSQIDSDEKASFEQLACLYGGFAVKAADSCRPVSEIELNDAEGKKTLYSCKSPPTKSSTLPVMSGNASGGAVVMCNPVLFGLKDKNPICISRGKNATEECGKKSAEISEILTFVQANPEEYRRLSRRVEFLCYADDMTISEHFAKRGKKSNEIDNSIRDLASTCVHIRGRMADLAGQVATGNAETGTR